MDYENFKEQIIEEVKEGLYEKGFEVDVQEHHVDKLNDGYDALTITPADSNIGMNLNINQLYEAYEDGQDFDAVVSRAVDTAARHLDDMPVVDVGTLTDYEQMKSKLAIEVVSLEANAEMLENIPHQEMEDMAVVYRFVLGSNDEGRSSILVTNNLLENMGVTPEQLHADALANAPEIRPAELKGMSQVMMEMMGAEQMIVATVPDKTGGAGVIAYPNFMEPVADQIGGEFVGLRWEDVDMDKRLINVNHQLVRVKRSREDPARRLGVSLPKTDAGIREIPMLDQVHEAFEQVYEEQLITGFNETVIEGMSGFVFKNANGDVLCEQNINSAIRRITESYNMDEEIAAKKQKRDPVYLPHFSCHVLRHTFCTRFCENETNLKVIQSVMGHKNIKTTMDVYAEATTAKKQESMQHLSIAWKDF